jgi:hypothetical protein
LFAGSQTFDFGVLTRLVELLFGGFHCTNVIQNLVYAACPDKAKLWKATSCYAQLRKLEDIEWEIRNRRALLDGDINILDLLLRMSVYDFGDPRDHIYGCLGLMELMRGQPLQDALLVPDYNLPASEVFTRAATLHYKTAPELDFIFSALVYHKHKRSKYIGLPSWVPDFADRSTAQFTGLEIPIEALGDKQFFVRFGASGIVPAGEAPWKIDGDVLIVEGVQLDTIKEGPDIQIWREQEMQNSWPDINDALWSLDYIAQEGLYPVGGQSREEAVIRSWTADLANSPELGDRAVEYDDVTMREWLALWIVVCVQEAETTQEHLERLRSKLDALQHRGSLPTFNAIMDADLTTGDGQADRLYRAHPYTQKAEVIVGKTLYNTERGYLSLASIQVLSGDEIWLVRGCRTPVILRKASGREGYVILGQAYVHGIMNGEALTEEVKRRFARTSLV